MGIAKVKRRAILSEQLERRVLLSAGYALTQVHDFNEFSAGRESSQPQGSLVADSQGNLYGETLGDPSVGLDGTIFEIPYGTSTLQVIAQFNDATGDYPAGGLAIDADGNLYGNSGASSFGGGYYGPQYLNANTIFEVDHATHALRVIAHLSGNDVQPGLVCDSAGNLYGVMSGGALVFELKAGDSTATEVAPTPSGFSIGMGSPALGLDSAGDLFLAVNQNAFMVSGESSAIFEITPGSGQMTDRADEVSYETDLSILVSAAGDVYFESPPTDSSQNIMELLPGSPEPVTVAALADVDGAGTTLSLDSRGDLFGVESVNVSDDTVFEIAAGTTTPLVLFTLPPNDSDAELTVNRDGSLWGVGSGAVGQGGIFSLSPVDSTLSAKFSFSNVTVTYDGNPHPAIGAAAGVAGENLTSDLGYEYLNTADPEGGFAVTPPVDVGTYEVFAVFYGATTSHGVYADVAAFDTGKTVVIQGLVPVITVTGASATYDGNSHPAVGVAVASDGTDLSPNLKLTYEDLSSGVLLNVPPVDPGTYEVFATFNQVDSDGFEYGNLPSFDTGKQVVIAPAAATLSAIGGLYYFDGQQHAATANAVGLFGENLNYHLVVSYKQLSDGTLSTEAPSEPGVYDVYLALAGAVDYASIAPYDTGSTIVISTRSPLVLAAPTQLPVISGFAGEAIHPVTIGLNLTNTGADPLVGLVTIQFIVSTSPTGATGGDNATAITRHARFGARATRRFGAITLRSLPAGLTGALYLVGTLTDSDGGRSIFAVASINAVAQSAGLTIVAVTAPKSASRGDVINVSVTVEQDASSSIAALLLMKLFLAMTPSISDEAIPLGLAPAEVKLRPHQRRVLHLTATVPPTLPPGSYYLIADGKPLDANVEPLSDRAIALRVMTVQ